MKTAKIRIGTRGSKLALVQADEVKNQLIDKLGYSKDQIEIVPIVTTGDKIQTKSLAEIGGKALFIKEIEEALMDGRVDIAVHSMKDMPAQLPEGMVIAAVLEREDPRDAFVSYKYKNLKEIPALSVLGTSSVRRQAQILNRYPEIKIVPFRGNVVTRLEKLKDGVVDSTVLALAGLKRIGLTDSNIIKPIEVDEMLPAVSQGAIGIECLQSNSELLEKLYKINHQETETCIKAERAFLGVLEGSCQTPLAALAKINNSRIKLNCLLASLDGKTILRTSREGSVKEAEKLGLDAGNELKSKGKI